MEMNNSTYFKTYFKTNKDIISLALILILTVIYGTNVIFFTKYDTQPFGTYYNECTETLTYLLYYSGIFVIFIPAIIPMCFIGALQSKSVYLLLGNFIISMFVLICMDWIGKLLTVNKKTQKNN